MNKTTSRIIAFLLFGIVAVVALSGNIIWLNFWTALSAALIVTALGLLFRKDSSKKRDGYNPQPTIPSQPLQDQLLQNNTDNIYNINNSPNSVINVVNSEKNQNEENSEG